MANQSVAQISNHDEMPPATGIWRDAIIRLRRHRLGMFGATIVVLLVLTAVFGPYLTPYDPNEIDMSARFLGPTLAHPMGTDDFGRDTLSRVMYGARVSLQVGIIAVSIAATVGTLLGLIAGYAGRVVDERVHRRDSQGLRGSRARGRLHPVAGVPQDHSPSSADGDGGDGRLLSDFRVE